MRKREKQWIAEYQLNHGLKNCVECGEEYLPNSGQGKQQKYCSKTCKNRVLARYNRNKGFYKGGYPRHIYIILWMKARGEEEITAPCHSCNKRKGQNEVKAFKAQMAGNCEFDVPKY